MPTWFIRLKYTSFIRQLNTYNFKRVNDEGPNKGALYHERFIREAPELAVNIHKVKKRRGGDGKSTSSMPRIVSREMTLPPVNNEIGMHLQPPTLMPQMKAPFPFEAFPPFDGTLRSLMSVRGMASLPVPQGPLDLSPLQGMGELEPTPINSASDSSDLFEGLNWLETDNCPQQNVLSDLVDAPSITAFSSSTDCLDLEPVPISPLMDEQKQLINECESFLAPFPANG